MNLNKVQLIGRLTRDPEVRTTQSGQTVTTIGLATNRNWTDKNGQKQEQSEYHNIVLWGKLAEIAGQYLVKGQEAYFEGRLQTRKYQAKDGSERYTTEIVAENMQMGAKPQGASYTPRPAAAQAAAPAAAGAASTPKAAAPQQSEDIPTINLDDVDDVNIEDVPF